MFIKILGIVLLAQFWSSGVDARPDDIPCNDFKNINAVGNILYRFGSRKRNEFEVGFYIATRKHNEHVKIEMGDFGSIKDSGFDPALKTILIVHGWKSGGTKSWVIELKNKLLDAVNANVVMVDWAIASQYKNYVHSARHTQVVTNKIFNFLQALRPRAEQLVDSSNNNIEWNHLYCIGHSLGAQICGQSFNLLKRDDFWKLDRITGLDPAKPCFAELDSELKLDKNDADFVDIIHTQVGKKQDKIALGTGERIGHVDFYVNGGAIQPECNETSLIDLFTNDLMKEICSHKLSYKYFTNAVAESVSGGCSFASYSWDGSYDEAEKILADRINGVHCSDCPPMGLDAIKSSKKGMFIVITAESKPYCERVDKTDFSQVSKVIQKLKGATSIFTRA